MRFAWIFTFFLICGCAASHVRKDKEKASYHSEIGTTHLMRGQPRLALASLIQAEKLDPHNTPIQNNLGVTYFTLGKYDLAEEHLKKAIKLDPSYTDARNNLGGLYVEVGKYDEAINHLERCLADLTYPYPEKVHMNLGLAYFKLKKFDQSVAHLKKTLDLKREHCQAMTYYGRANYELKDFRVAAQSLDQAVYFCREVKFDEPYFFSGLSFLRLGNRERAAARFEEVVKLYPEGSYASQARALLDNLQ